MSFLSKLPSFNPFRKAHAPQALPKQAGQMGKENARPDEGKEPEVDINDLVQSAVAKTARVAATVCNFQLINPVSKKIIICDGEAPDMMQFDDLRGPSLEKILQLANGKLSSDELRDFLVIRGPGYGILENLHSPSCPTLKEYEMEFQQLSSKQKALHQKVGSKAIQIILQSNSPDMEKVRKHMASTIDGDLLPEGISRLTYFQKAVLESVK